MGHAPPRSTKPARPSPMGRGYYPPSEPSCDCAERYRRHQAHRLGVFLGGLVAVALGVLLGGEVLAILGGTVAVCAILSPPSPTIVTAHRRRTPEPPLARWLDEPPLSLPGLSDYAARTYHAAAVQALMDDAMTPAQFEEALDRLWHDPKKAVADEQMKAAVARVRREVVWKRDGERQYRRRHSGPSDSQVLAVQVEAGAAKTVARLVESGALSPAAARETLGMLGPVPPPKPSDAARSARPEPDSLRTART